MKKSEFVNNFGDVVIVDEEEKDEEVVEEKTVYKTPFVVNDHTLVKFGKYLNRTHKFVLDSDPKYSTWVVQQGEKFFWKSSQNYFKENLNKSKTIHNISFMDYVNLYRKDKKELTEDESKLLRECKIKLKSVN